MNDERLKILEMLADGIITSEEANMLLETLEKTNKNFKEQDTPKSSFKQNLKEDLEAAKEDLMKAKKWIGEKIKSVDLDSVKDKLSKSMNKIEKAIDKIDDKILNFAEKSVNNIKTYKQSEKEGTSKSSSVIIDVEVEDE